MTRTCMTTTSNTDAERAARTALAAAMDGTLPSYAWQVVSAVWGTEVLDGWPVDLDIRLAATERIATWLATHPEAGWRECCLYWARQHTHARGRTGEVVDHIIGVLSVCREAATAEYSALT